MPDTDRDDFLTIAEAARLLGVSERTARRHAGRLSDSDRQTPDNAPVRVRVSALRERLGMSTMVDKTPDSDGHVAGQKLDSAGQHDPLLREIIDRQDTQIQTLTKALDQAQQLHLATIAELREVRQKSEQLETENRRLLEAAPVVRNDAPDTPGQVSDSDGQMPVSVSTGDAQGQETGPGGIITPPTPTEGGSGAKVRPWWRFWGKD